MAYNKKVLDHYENPRNVGVMDTEDINVGTGMVGAPACFSYQTKIAISDNSYIEIGELAENNKDILVWSYNISDKEFELNNARIVCSGEKETHEIIVNQEHIWVTKEHLFLLIDGKYKENILINKTDKLMPFYVRTSCKSSWPLNRFDFVKTMAITGNTRKEETFTLQVEENNNYVIVTNYDDEHVGGFVVKNCGDVMRLQIMVSDEGVIEDAKFKTYGCFVGNTLVDTPNGQIKISELSVGDEVLAWDGVSVKPNKINTIISREVNLTELMTTIFKTDHRNIILTTTKEHIFWSSSDKPELAREMKLNTDLFLNQGEDKVLGIAGINKDLSATDLDLENNRPVVYDLKLDEGAHVYFTSGIGSHNCGSAIASSSLLTEWVKGKTLQEASEIKNVDIVEELKLPPVKVHCSVLAEDCIKSAINNYNEKRTNNE